MFKSAGIYMARCKIQKLVGPHSNNLHGGWARLHRGSIVFIKSGFFG